MDAEALIRHNVRAHDRVAHRYARDHGEIFNGIEQVRLRASLATAAGHVQSGGLRALDFGCGSGNLSQHLVALGAHVIAADVSQAFLDQMVRIGLETSPLNGRDLSQFPDASFDLVATYSVLHHVPDYLLAVREMVRVLKPGGVLYIDHEVAPCYWQPCAEYKAYRATISPRRSIWARLANLARPSWYLLRARLLVNPRWSPEGDIHVWPDDHIEWDRVEQAAGVEVLERKDYLLARRGCPPEIYEQHRDWIADMRCFVGRKPV